MADYGSTAGVAALVPHQTNAAGSFDAETAPTLAQVEAFLAQTCDTLNGWLARAGYTIPVTAPRAVSALGHYANLGAAGMCELTQRTAGFSEDENTRENAFLRLFREAGTFIASGALAALGATQAVTAAPGIQAVPVRYRGDTASDEYSRGTWDA